MSDQVDQMAPDASPGDLPKKSGVRRLNDRPLYILGAVLGAFLLVMMLVAIDRAAKQNAKQADSVPAVGSTRFAQEIVGDRGAGTVAPPAMLEPPDMPTKPDTAPVLVARPDNLNAPPPPPTSNTVHDEEAARIRMAKLQMFQEAVKAKTGVRVDAPRSSGSTGTPQTRDEIRSRLAELRSQVAAQQHAAQGGDGQIINGQGGDAQINQVAAAGGLDSASAQFAADGKGDRWRLDSKPEPPRTPYELRAGFVVPAILISGVNSDLPGQIMAQVAQNVYDTATGRHLLIPQGSRLVGTYASGIAYGQSRVLVAWQRIVFPDGKAMDIGAMPGGDEAGYAGFADQVNHHFMRVFGSAVLMSAVVAGINMSQSDTQSILERQRASDALSESLGQQLGMVTAQMIAKNLNIAPTIEIRPGYRFNVIVSKDMTFSKPYQSFDY